MKLLYRQSHFTFIAAILQVSLLAILLSPACAQSETDKTDNKSDPYSVYLSKNYTARRYILGPNDVLSIQVMDYPEYDQKSIRVQPDGHITLMAVGPLQVSGMSVEELYNVLRAKYKRYLRNPEITVNLESQKPFIVYVSGAVLNPGSYELDTDTSKNQTATTGSKLEVHIIRKTPLLSNVLVASGGLTYNADLEHIKIVNKLEGIELEVNLLDLLEKGNTDQDLYLMPGDSVQIPELPIAQAIQGDSYKKFSSASFAQRQIPVRVYGYVNAPGLIQLDTAQSNRLNSAISAAGGYLRETAYPPNKVYVSRVVENGRLMVMGVNPQKEDFTLLPNDVVYVPEKLRPKVGKTFDFMTRLIAPASAFASGYNSWALMFNPTRYQVQPYFRR